MMVRGIVQDPRQCRGGQGAQGGGPRDASKGLTVLHINDKLELAGGVEVCIRDTCAELSKRGHRAHWLALSLSGETVTLRSADGLFDWTGPLAHIVASPLGKAVDAGTVFHVHSLSEPRLLEALFKMAPVVRHMHDQRAFCPGQGKFWAKTETICTRQFGLHCFRHAYTQRCCNRHPKRLLAQYANTCYEIRQASHRYARIIANSSYTSREAIEAGFPADNIEIVSPSTPVTPEPDFTEGCAPVIVFVGRLSRTKGVHLLLDAFAEVLTSRPDARLEILGSGHDEDMIFQRAEALALGEAVRFLGWAGPEMIDQHVSRASVVAFPSIYPEAFGIVGIEAMMRGKPVVAFDVGGVSDWLELDRTGLACAVGDTDQFAESLTRLLSDEALRKRMGRAGREAAVARFSPDTYMSRLITIYRGAVSGAPLPVPAKGAQRGAEGALC